MLFCCSLLTVGLFSLLLTFDAAAVSAEKRRKGRRAAWRRRPNIMLMLTDDQDVELGSMEFMPRALRIFRQRGVEFPNAFVTTPICCPSRSSILTGQYVHNHMVLTNRENCTGADWRRKSEPRTMARYLADAGYRTGYFGKYLNEYDGSYIPPGWHEWLGLIKNSRFYNYSVNYNGHHFKHGDDYYRDYFTNLIANDSVTFLKRSKRLFPRQPVFLVLSFPAPHGPEDPAPQHSTLFEEVTTHRTSSWNYAPNPDKEWLLQHTGKMEPVHVVFTDFLHRRRLQTLQSVDDAVHQVISEFRDLRELSNTYVMYTSDHGYHLGQFGLIKGKNLPYDFDLKVPFFVRGPSVPRGLRVEAPVANIDLMPTILDMAGLPVPDWVDGRSLLPLLQPVPSSLPESWHNSVTPSWRDTLLIERGKMPKLSKVRERFMRQRDRYSKELRIQKECEKEEFAAPCKPFQQWECRMDSMSRWRIFKCRGRVSLEKECSCRPSRRRSRRWAEQRPKKKFQLVDDMELAQWEQKHRGAKAFVPEDLVDRWESQFFSELIQKEIVANNEWHQGIFDAVDVLPSLGDDELEDEEWEEEGEAESRRKRSTMDRKSRRRHKGRRFREFKRKGEVTVIPKKCRKLANESVVCRAEVYGSEKTWRTEKSSVEQRIRGLRQRIKQLKVIRRHLRKEKPQDSFSESAAKMETEEEGAEVCECKDKWSVQPDQQQHPLKIPFQGRLSDADLLAYAAERRGRKRARGQGRRGRKSEKKRFCNIPYMHCFVHDSKHWATPPLWPEALGAFCFCQNANNNTYWCLRTVNATHNTLYCEFVTGFVSYYDLTQDPHQLHNAVYQLSIPILEQMSERLGALKSCRGWRSCERFSAPPIGNEETTGGLG